MLPDGRQIWQIEDCESGILLICDRRHKHEGEHHVRLPSGMRVWWSNGVVSAATDACGVAQSLLEPGHAPVRLDAQGLNTKQTKQRRTNRAVSEVAVAGTARKWYGLK
jgi:hypothetical protein